MDYRGLADRALSDEAPLREEATAVLNAPDEDLLPLLDAAFQVRRRYFGRKVQIHFLINAKSGLCPEDCAYCSQSSISSADGRPLRAGGRGRAPRRGGAGGGGGLAPLLHRGQRAGPHPRGGRPHRRRGAADQIRPQPEHLLLAGNPRWRERAPPGRGGVDRLNHNLNTSERFHPSICTTHTYRDRVSTLEAARGAGLELCTGAIFGQGESGEDILEVCAALRALAPDSIPVNFLHAIPGTRLRASPPSARPPA